MSVVSTRLGVLFIISSPFSLYSRWLELDLLIPLSEH